MATQRLDSARWQSYFNRISRAVSGRPVEIEVAGLGLGDQIEGKWLSLIGLTYDPKNDMIDLATETLDDLIEHPREVYVSYGSMGLDSIDIVDHEGNHQIVKLKQPLALPGA